VLAVVMLCALLPVGWAAFAPVRSDSREALFRIPQGTWARRMAGDPVEILPDHIRLTLGLRDVLRIENHDDVPQIFSSILMMPGQSFRLPFKVASVNQFSCTAHASGQLTIIVDPFPATPWARLRWRALDLWERREAVLPRAAQPGPGPT
jgi:hypothetical protein